MTDLWQSQNNRRKEKKKSIISSMFKQPPQLSLPNFSCWALLRHLQHVHSPSTAPVARICQGKEECDHDFSPFSSFDLSDSNLESGENQKRESADSLSVLPAPDGSLDVATSNEVIDAFTGEPPQ
jgi:hypothetical protein